MKGSSEIESNRTVKTINSIRDSDYTNVRYSKSSFNESYLNFPQRDELSISTFLKYIPKIYKKPYRWTDLCDYCEYGLSLKKRIKDLAWTYGYAIETFENFDDEINIFQNLRIFFKSKNDDSAVELVKEYIQILFHKNVAKLQRNAYNNDRKNLKLFDNSILIVGDYKQRIKMGTSKRPVNDQFFKQKLRSCFSFGIYYKDKNDKIQCINFDIISNLEQTAETVVKYSRFMRNQSFFKDIEKNNYIIWMDAGTQFRCNEFADYLFVELAVHKITVSLNFFCEKHGI